MKLMNEVQKPLTSSPPLPELERNMKPNKTAQRSPPCPTYHYPNAQHENSTHLMFCKFFTCYAFFYNITCNQ